MDSRLRLWYFRMYGLYEHAHVLIYQQWNQFSINFRILDTWAYATKFCTLFSYRFCPILFVVEIYSNFAQAYTFSRYVAELKDIQGGWYIIQQRKTLHLKNLKKNVRNNITFIISSNWSPFVRIIAFKQPTNHHRLHESGFAVFWPIPGKAPPWDDQHWYFLVRI